MYRFLLLALLALSCRSVETAPARLQLMTFNIRYGTANDGEDRWPSRRELVADAIRVASPDVLALQEALAFQLEDLSSVLEPYTKIGQHRGGGEQDEFSGLYVRRSLQIVDQGEFWFSETPQVAASKSWDSSLPRMTAWVDVLFCGEPLRVYGTHYDHRGEIARRRASELILEHADESSCVVAMGDFNTREDEEPLALFWEAGYRSAILEVSPEETRGTFNGFRDYTGGKRIDHILVFGPLNVEEATLHSTAPGERFPSDHAALTATIVPSDN